MGGVGDLSKCSEMLSELKTRRWAVVKLSSSAREHLIASWGSTWRVPGNGVPRSITILA
ncbi:hypothetical protein A2U01_0101939 [Trifolium medium]|uniref:Uncharacterized protein n=1 Tax=Trifolium medium TaxID=97028 RepID=A0A392UXF1_9FABA|nr:hypothetical protein [Trifolium medium]